MYDVLVVGAGPSGSKTAELCAKLGLDVLIIDKKPKPGIPPQCTGLFSHRVLDLSGLRKGDALNEVKKARFYSPNSDFLELESEKPAYVFDRAWFDYQLFKAAKKAGSEAILEAEFLAYKAVGNHIRVETSSGSFESRLIVGADGPNSRVAKEAKISLPEDIIVGYQETMKGDFDRHTVELWFGKDVSPDFFAWVVPINGKAARVGIGCKSGVSSHFTHFISKRFGQSPDSSSGTGGVIRRGLIESSVADNTLLVGDAACQVKPYSGGGVVYGLMASKIAAEACYSAKQSGDYSRAFLMANYDSRWKAELSGGIKKGLFMDCMIHSAPDWGLNFGTKIANYMKGLLQKVDMDLI